MVHFGEKKGIYIRGETSLISIDNKGTISGYAFNKYIIQIKELELQYHILNKWFKIK